MGWTDVLFWLFTIVAAFFMGRLVAKIKLPAILGWLITGMVMGPHAFGMMSGALLEAQWYAVTINTLECIVGLMIGTELVWRQLKKAGKQIIVTTITESLGTFLVVSLVFGVIFWLTDVPLYLALIFGGIALATAPAPSLAIVREMRTDGPVTRTLIPMAALDDLVGAVVFFSVIAVVSAHVATSQVSPWMIVLVILLPIVIGIAVGFFAGWLMRRVSNRRALYALLAGTLLLAVGVGFVLNYMVLPSPTLNFLLIGMAYATTFANMISDEKRQMLMMAANPAIGFALVVVILNLGAPLDYHLILGAGLYTAVYIVSRAVGKYSGAYFGAAVTHAPKTVRRYLGLTLLPHSGVSLVFSGIAVSMLAGPAPACAQLISGTIAAAAVINEVIAVLVARKGFGWAGEFNKAS
nr:cation:proton antiporter [Maliibacterium massiliense]